MENITKTTLLLSLLVILFFFTPIFCNGNEQRSNQLLDYFWVSTGFGPGDGRLFTGVDVNLQKGMFVGTLRYEQITWLDTFWSRYFTTGLTGGVGFNHRTLYWGGSVGPSFSWGDAEVPSVSNDEMDIDHIEKKQSAGGLLNGYFLFAPFKSVGLGLSTTININKYASYFGIRSTVNWGRLGTPIVSRSSSPAICKKKIKVGRAFTGVGIGMIAAGSGTALGGLFSYMQYDGKGQFKGMFVSAIGGGTVVIGTAVFLIPGRIIVYANRNRLKELKRISFSSQQNGISLVYKF